MYVIYDLWITIYVEGLCLSLRKGYNIHVSFIVEKKDALFMSVLMLGKGCDIYVNLDAEKRMKYLCQFRC